VLNGEVKTIQTVTCDLYGGGPQWLALSIGDTQTGETFSVRFLGEPTVGTYPVVETELTTVPGATEAMIQALDGQATVWLADGGGDVVVADDGGNLNVVATNIPLHDMSSSNNGTGSVNVTCP